MAATARAVAFRDVSIQRRPEERRISRGAAKTVFFRSVSGVVRSVFEKRAQTRPKVKINVGASKYPWRMKMRRMPKESQSMDSASPIGGTRVLSLVLLSRPSAMLVHLLFDPCLSLLSLYRYRRK